jgi:hypothetical protein
MANSPRNVTRPPSTARNGSMAVMVAGLVAGITSLFSIPILDS